MGEFRRILTSRRYIITFLILIAANLIYFQYNERHILEKMADEKLKQEYIEDYMCFNEEDIEQYRKLIEGMEDNARELLNISIFKDSSFSEKNIKKTLKDYGRIADVEIHNIYGRCVESILEYKGIHIFVLVHTFILVLMFFDERKKGLWSITHTCRNGRAGLAFRRLIILLAATAAFCLVSYFLLYILAFHDYDGFGLLSEAVQSVSMLRDFTLPISIGGFLVYYAFSQTCAALLTALFIWLIYSVIHNRTYASVAVAFLILTGYYLTKSISIHNPLCILRYFNMYFLIDTTEVYTSYVNFHIGTGICNNREFIEASCVLLSIVMACACVAANALVKPVYRAGIVERIFMRICEKLHSLIRVCHGFGFEMYKHLIVSRGIFVIAAILYISYEGMELKDLTRSVFYTELKNFYQEYSGRIDGERLEKYEELKKCARKAEEKYAAAQDAFNAGQIDALEFEDAIYEYQSYEIDIKLVQELQYKVDSMEELEKRGIEAWFVDTDGVNHLIGDISMVKRTLNSLMALFVMILLAVMYQMGEKKSGTRMLIHSCSRGRARHMGTAVAALVVIGLVVCGIIYGTEYYDVRYSYGFGQLSAPVQNVEGFLDFPLKISIGTYLAAWYILRLLVDILAGAAVYFIFDYFMGEKKRCLK